METATENITFKYKGFDFEIIERPDKMYLYQVSGYNSAERLLFNPKVFFSNDLSFEQIRAAVFLMIDDNFVGKADVFGSTVIIVSFDIPFDSELGAKHDTNRFRCTKSKERSGKG